MKINLTTKQADQLLTILSRQCVTAASRLKAARDAGDPTDRAAKDLDTAVEIWLAVNKQIDSGAAA